MSSFFPWMGGKSRMADRLVALLPPHTCYVELFAGAANVLLARPPAGCEVYNDLNGELTNLFRIVRFHPRELISQLAWLTHSRAEYDDLRRQEGLTDIHRAAATYFRLKVSFGGRGGTPSPTYGYKTSGRAAFRRTAFALIRQVHKRLDGVHIENLDFADCIARYDRPHTCFYADPPYWQTGGYQVGFTWEDHRRLADRLRTIKGKFLLTINDHPDIRRLYRGLPRRKVNVRYSVSRDKSAEATERSELLIANYKLSRRNGVRPLPAPAFCG